MDMRKITLLGIIFLTLSVKAAHYTTPGTGVKWTFADLVTNSEGVVTANPTNTTSVYYINDTLTIASGDEISVESDIIVYISEGINVTFESANFTVNAPNQAVFTTASQDLTYYYGVFAFRDDSKVNLKNAKFTYGKGIMVSLTTGSFTADYCEFSDNYYSSSTSGAISLTKGSATVTNSRFLRNTRAAIASGANMGSTFYFANNYLEGNTTSNSNRPQINLGPCAEGDTTKIIGNTIIGNRSLTYVGGISTSSLLSVPCAFIIKDNIIQDNRYGITLTGSNIYGEIINNVIKDNDSQNNPSLGGSGINITSSAGSISAKITGNTISGNLWGITSVGNTSNYSAGPNLNLGNLNVAETDINYNPGLNVFSDNGNGGVLYDFYNNSPIDVMAQGNIWGVNTQDSTSIEAVVVHKVDDSRYGFVTFMKNSSTGVASIQSENKFNICPSMVTSSFTIDILNQGVEIFNLNGKLVYKQDGNVSVVNISFLETGMYIVRLRDDAGKIKTAKFNKIK